MRKYAMEFIGTFFLVFTIGMTVLAPGAGTLAPVAIGLVLAAFVYAGGHISGAHYNPAVTLAVWMRKRCDTADVAPYIVAQCTAAAAAAATVMTFKDTSTVAAGTFELMPTLLAELLFTFALVTVILNVATSKSHPNNAFYGLAIGSIVTGGAFAVGGVSGGVFNPAVAIGVVMLGLINAADIWMHIVADFVGGGIGALVFTALNPDDQ